MQKYAGDVKICDRICKYATVYSWRPRGFMHFENEKYAPKRGEYACIKEQNMQKICKSSGLVIAQKMYAHATKSINPYVM